MSRGILGSSGGAGYKVTVAYEWGRLIWWLGQGQNGIAVQAIAAIAASVATVVLFGIRAWYAITTRGLLRISENQLRASLRPDLFLDANATVVLTDPCLNVRVEVHNNANLPIKIENAVILLAQNSFTVEKLTGRVLIAGDKHPSHPIANPTHM
jgi:hypothetical protein